ncbi:hypothetical protein BDR26DRAFT_890707 [Obelidium mucronatum]|nr:hypothetical protein BDR26DRAFT_890707 [Obelidium mucronatum]
MHLRSVVTLLATAAVALAQCSNPIVRQEWGQLSSSQKSQFVQACVALAKRPLSGQSTDPSTMSWHDFTITHSRNAYWAHGNAQFYPYHRAMLHQFELALRSTGIWPANQGIPYFDWSGMSQNWWTSDIFTDQYFGAINNPSDKVNNCVVDGAFKKSVYSVAPDAEGYRQVTGTDTKCLRRNAGQFALTDAITITQSLSATTFLTFTSDSAHHYYDETNYHAGGHGILGGGGSDMANPAVSPNDPIFWLHHGFVDKYYWRWQQQCEAFKFDYSGTLARADDPVSDGTNIAKSNMYVDSWPWTVSQMLNTQGSVLCYTYSQSSGDLPAPAITCPAFDASKANTTEPPPPPPSDATDNLWLNKLFNALINQKKLTSFNAAAAGGAAAVGSGSTASNSENEIVFGRRDGNVSTTVETTVSTTTGQAQSTDQAEEQTEEVLVKEAYYVEEHADGSQTVSFVLASDVVEIPANYTIAFVNHASVTAFGLNGKPKRFYPEIEINDYIPTGSGNIAPGSHPCYLAYPAPLSRSFVESLGKSYAKYRNIRSEVLKKVDAFNADNCQTLWSPSSAMNFQSPVVNA